MIKKKIKNCLKFIFYLFLKFVELICKNEKIKHHIRNIVYTPLELKINVKFNEYGFFKSAQDWECYDKEMKPLPWYTYPAIEYLDSLDFSQKNIFEYGSGNSSLWWASRSQKVFSVESNKEWFISREKYKLKNLTIVLEENEEGYVNAINNFKDSYDVIIIDGILRKKCLEIALKKLSSSGMLIFDDFNRIGYVDEYKEAFEILKKEDFIQIDFKGFAPLIASTKTTSVFLPREFVYSFKNMLPSADVIAMEHKA